MLSQTYGTCSAPFQGKREFLTLSFSPLSTPLRSRWRNNGLSADFLGEYVITFLPAGAEISAGRDLQIRHAVAYIANELLENAMKYHEQSIDTPIQIHLELADDHITVSATNAVASGQARTYRSFVEYLLEQDPVTMYFERLEASAQQQGSDESGLGLLTMVNDHEAQLGWKFEDHPLGGGAVNVTTSAVLRFEGDLEAAACTQ
jgi:hypothetical protein